MNHNAMTLLKIRARAVLAGLALGLVQASASAAPGTLANTPLYLSTQVEPNIMFILDDSLSMDWSLMVPSSDGNYGINGPTGLTTTYYYMHPSDDNALEQGYLAAYDSDTHFYSAPRQAMLDTYTSFFNTYGYSNWQGAWRLRNPDYNKLYYNPKITYKPWLGVDVAGNSYTDSTPTAAYLDPYLAGTVSGNTVDLTTVWTYKSYIPTETGTPSSPTYYSILDTAFFPSYYNTWTDSNSDGVVDASDGYSTVLIQPATATYTGSTERNDCAAAPTCTYAEEIQNFANWFTYYRRRSLSAKNAASSVIAGLSSARAGFVTINNDTSINTPVTSMNLDPVSGNKRTLLDNVFQTPTSGFTPLRTALNNVGQYYESGSSTLFSSLQSSPILPAGSGGTCQHNFSVLVTDGYYNGSSPSLSNTDGDGNTVYDGNSYGDTISDTLADVAMNFYERDLNTSLADQVPTRAGLDEAAHQHMVTYSIGFGINGTLDPSSDDPTASGFTWPDPQPNNASAASAEKVDDLWHASYNGRGNYFSASDSTNLNKALTDAMSSIVSRSSSAAAVAFNSTTLGTGSVVYLARFNSGNWGGELLAHALDPFTGAVDPLPIWNSATQLDAASTSGRVIYTYNDDTLQGTAFRTLADLSAKQQGDLNTSPAGTSDGLGQARLDYLRGSSANEGTGYNFRIRSSRHGDIVHSNPVYVGRPLMSYPDTDPVAGGYFDTLSTAYSTFKLANASRSGVIYVGSNDGMLHGFDEDTGDEVMAYVPNAVSSASSNKGLHYLTDPNYIHQYYVDLSPTVADAHVKTTPSGTAAWHTILLGGLRSGGRGIFALDVTDPTVYSDANADDVVMWEFTSSDDPDMGYSFSKPTIALMNNDRWAAIFGNGYNNTGDYKAKLFVVYLDGGLDGTWVEGVAASGTADEGDYMKIEAHNNNISISASDPNGLSTPQVVDLYNNGRADWIYAGDLKGNMWVFDVTSSNADNWDIAYSTGQTPKPLFTAMIGSTPQPITSKPVVVQHPSVSYSSSNKPDLMVYFGTGQFLVEGDKTSTDVQTMYGVWDKGTKSLDRSKLVAQTFVSGYPANTRVTTNNAVSYSSNFGWYIDLPTSGERIVVNPKIRSHYVFYNTLIPNNTACSYGGSGWLMVVEQENGGPPMKSVYDVNNDGAINDSDRVGSDNAVASGMLFSEGLPAESNFLGDNQYTPGSSGELQQNDIDADTQDEEGRRSWKEIINHQ